MTVLTPKDRWSNDVKNYDVPHLRLRTVAHLINLFNPKSVLDLGCAKGTLSNLIPSVDYIGCDFIEPQVKYNFRFLKCDFNREKIPTEIDNIEMVVTSGLLEYIENLPLFISQIVDILPKNGVFIATYFNMNHFSRRLRKIIGSQVHIHPDWRGMYSLDELREMLIENGFLIKKIIPISHSFSTSKPVNHTMNEEVRIDGLQFYSLFLAHQYIYVCEKNFNNINI